MKRRTPAERDKFLKQARDRFKQGQDAIEKQRKRELDDLRFYAGEQWDPETKKNREAQQGINGLPPTPARPTLVINKVREPVHQVLNMERQSDMSVELVEADDFGPLQTPIDETELELREGLVRRIQRESEAADARTWAFMRATIAGVGYYGVKTRYLKGKTFDQEVYVERFYNQSAITLDPAHEQPDGSDAEWGFEGSDVPWDRYKAEHKKAADGSPNRAVERGDADFRSLGEEYPGWFTSEGDTKSARVVNYWYTEREERTLVQLVDGTVAWRDELPDGLPAEAFAVDDEGQLIERPEIRKTIKWAKIDAVQILDETDWPGQWIPIIKVLGEELQPYDQERRVEGMVRPARHGCEGFNAFVSKFVEVVGLTPLNNVMAAEGQLENYKEWWQVRNTRALPFLPFRQRDLEGNVANPPVPLTHDSAVQELAMGLQIFDEAIKSTTMVPSVQLGHGTDTRLKSGKALSILKEQADLGTSNYLDNLRRSIRHEGEIENDLLYPIYGRPGRLVRMLTGEGESQTVRIGPPQQPGLGPAPMMPSGNGAGPGGKVYRLTKDAQVNVIVKVTRGFESRREEEATTIGNLIQANPAFIGWFGDLFFKNQDGPGHEEMAERAKIMLDPKIQSMLQQQGQGAPVPPEAQAQIAQLTGKLQQAEQILAQAKQELEGKQAEQAGKVKIEQDKLAFEQWKVERELATKLAIAHISAGTSHLGEVREDLEESIALGREHLHDANEAEKDRQHERDQAATAHANALEQGAQSAALQPSPQASTPEQGA